MNCGFARLNVLGTKTLPTVSPFERAELVNTISRGESSCLTIAMLVCGSGSHGPPMREDDYTDFALWYQPMYQGVWPFDLVDWLTHSQSSNLHVSIYVFTHTHTHIYIYIHIYICNYCRSIFLYWRWRWAERDRDRQTQTDADRRRQTQTDVDRRRQTQTQTDTDTDRHRHRQTDTDADRNRQTETDTDRHRQTQTDTDRTDRHRQTQTDTDRHRQTQTDTDRHRQTQTDTDRHRQTDRQTERERERDIYIYKYIYINNYTQWYTYSFCDPLSAVGLIGLTHRDGVVAASGRLSHSPRCLGGSEDVGSISCGGGSRPGLPVKIIAESPAPPRN